jgi:hypothetical protein
MLCVLSQEMQVLVLRNESLLNVSGFLLTTEYCYYAEGGWNFEVEIS